MSTSSFGTNHPSDLPGPPAQDKFPTHGWTKTGQGTVLWLPINRMILGTMSGPKPTQDLGQSHVYNALAFSDTVQKLILTLGRLNHHIDGIVENSFIGEDRDRLGNPETMENYRHHENLAPLFVDLTYTYLRRTVRLFTKSVRPVLFNHVGSAPQSLNGLKNHPNLDDLGTKCDTEKLIRALKHHTDWLTLIRDSEAGGLRDILEHHLVSVSIDHSATKKPGEEWTKKVEAVMDYPGQDRGAPYDEDIIDTITDVTIGLCRMWTEICKSVDWGEKAGYYGVTATGVNSTGGGIAADGLLILDSFTGGMDFWPKMPE